MEESKTVVELVSVLKNEDPELWKTILALKKYIHDGKIYFIDDHGFNTDEDSIERIFIVTCIKDGKIFSSWLGPLLNSNSLCKNPFYITTGELHLSTSSRGITLDSSEITILIDGSGVVEQSGFKNTIIERTIGIKVADLLSLI